MSSTVWQEQWTRAMNTCTTCSSDFSTTDERSMSTMNCSDHLHQHYQLYKLQIDIIEEQAKRVLVDRKREIANPGWTRENAHEDHNAPGQLHILQRNEELDVEDNIDQVLDQFPEPVLVSHAIVPGSHRLVLVPDLENHNHHLWLNIKRSVQPKALHHPDERTVGCVAIF